MHTTDRLFVRSPQPLFPIPNFKHPTLNLTKKSIFSRLATLCLASTHNRHWRLNRLVCFRSAKRWRKKQRLHNPVYERTSRKRCAPRRFVAVFGAVFAQVALLSADRPARRPSTDVALDGTARLQHGPRHPKVSLPRWTRAGAEAERRAARTSAECAAPKPSRRGPSSTRASAPAALNGSIRSASCNGCGIRARSSANCVATAFPSCRFIRPTCRGVCPCATWPGGWSRPSRPPPRTGAITPWLLSLGWGWCPSPPAAYTELCSPTTLTRSFPIFWTFCPPTTWSKMPSRVLWSSCARSSRS